MRLMRNGTLALVLWAGVSVPTRTSAQLSGRVIDSTTRAPVPGARVTLQATAITTMAARDGSFAIGTPPPGPHTIVAAAPGYFHAALDVPGAMTQLELELDAVPSDDDTTAALPGPETCVHCHPTQFAEWRGSGMGQAGRNSWVADLYDGSGTPGGLGGFVYVRDSMLASRNPGSECAACHQPEVWLRVPGAPIEPPASLSLEAGHGVACSLCHRIAHIDESKPNTPGVMASAVTVRRPRDPSVAVQYGLLGDVSFHAPSQMRGAYQPQLASAVCAACHQDKNDPDLDGDFEQESGVVSEPTYLEWKASPYGDPASERFKPCTACHMPPSSEDVACIVQTGVHRPPGQLRGHGLAGTTPAFLEAAATVTLAATAGVGEIDVRVDVVNDRAGHHVPTGVTTRNVILLVEATSADGSGLEATSGERLHALAGVGSPGRGQYAGQPGKLYAKVPRDLLGNAPVFFTEAAGIALDTRIPALASDTTRYRFHAPPGGGRVRIHARLIYRRAFRSLVDAKGWSEDGHGRPLEDLLPPHYGHLMAEAEQVLEVPLPPDASAPDGATDAGTPDRRTADGPVLTADATNAPAAAPGPRPSGCGTHGDRGGHPGWGVLLAALCLGRGRLARTTASPAR